MGLQTRNALRGYSFCLHKAYFDCGYALTSYIKLIITVVGIGRIMVGGFLFVGIMVFGYAIFCYFLGRWWYLSGFALASAEVGNQFNLFQKEMRKKLK